MKNVQDDAVDVGGPPQPVDDAAHVHVQFIEVPAGTPTGFPLPETLSKQVAELDAPRADRLASHADSSFWQEFFNVSIAQREPVTEPDGVPHDLTREPVAGKLLTAEHRATLPKQLATTLIKADAFAAFIAQLEGFVAFWTASRFAPAPPAN